MGDHSTHFGVLYLAIAAREHTFVRDASDETATCATIADPLRLGMAP